MYGLASYSESDVNAANYLRRVNNVVGKGSRLAYTRQDDTRLSKCHLSRDSNPAYFYVFETGSCTQMRWRYWISKNASF